MSLSMDMEWNAKWDWENLVACSNRIESPKNLQLVDWTIVDDGEIHAGSFNMPGGGGGGGSGGSSGASGSDGRHGSSAKSSISDSSCKDGMQTSIFKLGTSEGSSGNFSKKIEMNAIELSGTSPTPETSVASAEALLGLKLGKRTYFENSNGGAAVKSTSSITTPKKTRTSGQNAPICCQVEGCNADLSLAKEYHRKHRVCDSHSKFPKVIVGGRERRFCQQCSRFHGLSEFDEKKRSCRRRLSDHNARRRKPHQETIQFNPPRLSAPLYGGTQQLNFVLNNSPLLQSRPLANSAWNASRFTLTKGSSLKSDGDEGTDEQFRMQNAANGILASKNPTSVVLNPVSKASVMSSSSSSLEAAPEYRRALSLLSNNSWNTEAVQFHHQLHENSFGIIHPMVHEIPQGIPFSSSELWSPGPHPAHHQVQVQSLGTLYDADFYSNVIN